MTTLELRQPVETPRQPWQDVVARQVSEIIASAETDGQPPRRPAPEAASWNYTIPFAGVRYYGYPR